MKMCSISVEPMPSRIGLPVFATQSLNTGAGSVSPADTAMRSDDRSAPLVHRRQHGAIGGRRGERDRRLVGLDDLDHVGGRGVFQQRRGRAEAQRKDRQAAEAEGEGERRRADEDVVRRHAEDFLGVAVGDDEQIAMEMHGRLRLAGGAGGEAEQRHVVAPGLHGVERHGLAQRDAVELGIVIGGAVEADHLLQELAVLGAGDELVHQPRVAERQRDLGLVDDLAKFAGAQHRHGVDDDGAGLGGGEPARHHRRIVGGADQDAVAGLDAEILDQRVRDAVGPVGQFLVGAAAAVADQRDVVAEAVRHHAVGQFDAGIEVSG